MIDLSNYSCDKCSREFSRHCKHCFHTKDKVPTKFKRNPTSKSNATKPNPNYVPPASVKSSCSYITPCGWCNKWDKKCDCKIGCDTIHKLINDPADAQVDLTKLIKKGE